jgi:hypothetical protein
VFVDKTPCDAAELVVVPEGFPEDSPVALDKFLPDGGDPPAVKVAREEYEGTGRGARGAQHMFGVAGIARIEAGGC